MNVIIANAPMLNGNRGCVALSLSIMSILDEIFKERNIECVYYLPESGHGESGEYCFHTGSFNINYRSCYHIELNGTAKVLKNLVKIKQVINSLKIYNKADFILDIGQGDSFSDIYGKQRFNNIFSEYRLGKLFNIPYCILPQTIGPFNDYSIRKKAVCGMKHAKLVLVRDKQSCSYIKELLPNKEVVECIDVAFFMPFSKKVFSDEYVHVGLNVSALLWHGGYTMNNEFDLSVDYQGLIISIIDYFLSKENIKLHLIPHVVGAERGIENDYAVSYDLFEKYHHENLLIAPLFLDPVMAKSYIAGMDFFMGARMHATIAAFSTGVPVYPMAYSRKFNGLFADTLEYSHLGDMKKQGNDDIIQSIHKCYIQRDVLKKLVDSRMETIVEERRQLLKNSLIKMFGV